MQDGKIKNWGLPQIVRIVTWFQKDIPTCSELSLFIDKVRNVNLYYSKIYLVFSVSKVFVIRYCFLIIQNMN